MNERKRNAASDKRAASLKLKPRRKGNWCVNFVFPEKSHIADVCMAHRRVEVINDLNKRYWK